MFWRMREGKKKRWSTWAVTLLWGTTERSSEHEAKPPYQVAGQLSHAVLRCNELLLC